MVGKRGTTNAPILTKTGGGNGCQLWWFGGKKGKTSAIYPIGGKKWGEISGSPKELTGCKIALGATDLTRWWEKGSILFAPHLPVGKNGTGIMGCAGLMGFPMPVRSL
ncbi:hypothetical protein A3860_06585 [Niastella vici]|uniref:Uncharacterized protein n=1 Tax=Niastella vici TaxID=1703345 RepID=A0A1V9FST3_9BACT|nr:hypothetical protein A3860_06585 [Niastella vici]